MRKRYLIAPAVAAVVACIALFTLLRAGTDPLQPDADDVVALGQKIYATHCASCHGADLEGQPEWRKRGADGRLPAPPHDETGHTWHHPSQMLFEMTKYGVAKFAPAGYKTDMPDYERTLSDDEIIAVLSFIKSRWPSAVRERHDQLNNAVD